MPARSRLQPTLQEPTPPPKPNRAQGSLQSPLPRRSTSLRQPSALIGRYKKHLLLLALSLLSYSGVWYVLNNIRPQDIAHTPLPFTYGALQLPLFFANFFLFSFVLLNTRRGLLISIFITALLFLKLQLFILTATTVLSIFGLLFLAEVVATVAPSKKKK